MLSLVLSCQSSLAVIPGTDQVPVSGSSDDVRDWLEPGESWFCEEHHQIALAPEDIPEGYEQICLDCNPDVLALASASPLAAEGDVQALFPSGVAWSKWVDDERVWTNCSTMIGEDQTVLYKLNSRGGGRAGNVLIRLIFSSQVQKKAYFNFSSTSSTASSNSLSWNQISGVVSFSVPSLGAARSSYNLGQLSNGYYPVSLNKWLDGISGNTVYFGFYDDSFSNPLYNASIGSFSFSAEPFLGTVGGPGGGSGGGTGPEEPGFDDPDGWLGGLIDSIIEGINKVIDGISNVAQNVASLPSNIAGALTSLFNKVVSAVTSIGDQITDALTSLGNFLIDGLKQLFIPSDGYFEGVANDLSSFFSDRLGLLLYPFNFLVSLGDRIAGLQTGEPTCTIPEIAYTDSDDNKYVLIEGQTLNVYELVGRNDIIIGMHQTYLTVMDGIIAFTLMALCWKRFDHIIGGGAE